MAIATLDLALVIERLKSEVRGLRLVAGAADLAALREAPPLALPAAYVVPLAERAEPDALLGVVEQRLQLTFGVLLAVRSLRDARGEAAQNELRGLRDAVLAALMGWTARPDADPCEYAGGRLLQLNDTVLWWGDDYRAAYFLRND